MKTRNQKLHKPTLKKKTSSLHLALALVFFLAAFLPLNQFIRQTVAPELSSNIQFNNPYLDSRKPNQRNVQVLGEAQTQEALITAGELNSRLFDYVLKDSLKKNQTLAGDVYLNWNEKLKLARNSVKSREIVRHAIEAEDIDTNSITSRTIRNHTIQGEDINPDTEIALSAINATFITSDSGNFNTLTIDSQLTTYNLQLDNILDFGVNTIADGQMIGDWDFNGGSLTNINSVTGTTGNLTTLNLATLDLGTNTIADGNFTGDWNFNGGDLTTTGNITAGTLNAGATTLSGNLDMQNNIIQNVGNANTDFTATGGLTLAGNLNVSGTGTNYFVGSIFPSTDISVDLGDPTHRFNNLYSANIITAAISTSGQAVFNYEPANTNYAESSVLINPTTAIANAPLLGIGVGGVERFRIDEDGDLTTQGNISAGTYNGLTITTTTGTFTLTNGKTLTVSDSATLANNTLTLGNGKVLTLSDSITLNTNAITFAGTEILTLAATKNVTFADTFTTAGAFPLTLTTTNTTNVTLPTTGTLYGTATDSITSLQLLTSISDETGSGKLTFATAPTFLTGVTLGDSTAATFTLTSLLSGATDPTLTFGDGMLTVSDDLTITGDDLFMNTNTANYFLMADGTNYNPVTPAAARTGLGLDAAGAGDIWVERAGDTMTGNLLFTDNQYDIGANGATRPRTGYFGTSIVAPTINATTALQINGNSINTSGTLNNVAYLNAANSFTLNNPLTTIAESWIGPSATAGIYFKGGNVGIGTTDPTRLLGLGGDATRVFGMERGTLANTAGYDLTINGGGATSLATDKNGGNLIIRSGVSTGLGTSQIQFWTAPATGAISAISINSLNAASGGTGYTLNDVLTVTSGSGDATVTVTGVDGGVVTTVTLTNTGTSGYTIGIDNPTTGGTGTGCILNITAVASGTGDSALTQRMTILGNGNVGIGTTAPTHTFEVFGRGNQAIATFTGSGMGGGTVQYKATDSYGYSGANMYDNSNNLSASFQYGNPDSATWPDEFVIASRKATTPISFYQGGVAAGNLRITMNAAGNTIFNTGLVGIGTTSPWDRLHVLSNADTKIRIESTLTGGAGQAALLLANSVATVPFEWLVQGMADDGRFRIYDNAGASIGERLTITTSGNVGIGTTNPTAKLHAKSVYSSQLWGSSYWSSNDIDSFSASKVNDGITNDQAFHTDSADAGAWIKIDVGAGNEKEFTKIRYWAGGGYVAIWDIQYSDNDNSWSTVYSGWNSGSSGDSTIEFNNAGKHRYWRLYKTNAAGAGAWQSDIQFYERPAPLRLANDSGDNFIVNHLGNVGIGTTGPGSKLHIASANVLDAPQGDIIMSRLWTSTTTTRASSIFHYYDTPTTSDMLVFGVSGDWSGGNDWKTPNQISMAKMVIKANGNVGIGTTNPSATKLAVVGNIGLTSSAVSTDVRVSNSTGGLTNSDFYMSEMNTGEAQLRLYGAYPMSFWTNNTQKMTILSGGNVGIGTAGPRIKLEVIGTDAAESGSATPNGAIMVSNPTAANSQVLTMGTLNGAGNYSWIQSRNSTSASFYSLALNPSGGNVGIGTTNPGYALQVNQATVAEPYIQGYFNNTTASSYGGIGLNGVNQSHLRFFINGTVKWQIRAGEGVGTDAMSIYSWTKGNDVMYFKNDGNVGIGTTGPVDKLNVIGNITQDYNGSVAAGGATQLASNSVYSYLNSNQYYGTGADRYARTAGATQLIMGTVNDPGAFIFNTAPSGTAGNAITFTERMRIQQNGNVGIGMTPSYQLDLSTDSARKLTTTTWATGSDSRIKTQVESINDALDIIGQVRPVKFHYTEAYMAAHPSIVDTDYYNFIAQEYQKVFPNSVTETDGLLYLNSSNMIPYAIAGIKELAALTDAQQLQIAGISGAQNLINARLQTQMDALKTMYLVTDLTSPERLVKWSEMQNAITLAFNQKQATNDPTLSKILEMQTRINRLEGKIATADLNTSIPEEIVFQSFAAASPEVISSLAGTEFLENTFSGNYTTPNAYSEIRINNSGLDLSQYEVADGYLKFQVYMENADSFSEFVTELGNETDIQEIQWNSSAHPYFFAGWNEVNLKISDGIQSGEIDWTKLDYFRIYFKFKTNNQIRLKDIKLILTPKATTLVADGNASGTILPLDTVTEETSNLGVSTAVSQQDLVNSLQSQVADIQVENKAISSLLSVVDGNYNLMEGTLESAGVVAGAFTVKAVDAERKTIGTGILPVGETQVEIQTKAIGENSKVFVTAQAENAVIYPLTVTAKTVGVGFTVEIPEILEADLSFDWWIVESR